MHIHVANITESKIFSSAIDIIKSVNLLNFEKNSQNY